MIRAASRSYADGLSGRCAMDVFRKFAEQLVRELIGWFDWAITHWSITIMVLALLIYWAGRQRRLHRHHL
jgi:hypothetical protein